MNGWDVWWASVMVSLACAFAVATLASAKNRVPRSSCRPRPPRYSPSAVRELEAELAEPIEDVIARAEQQVESPTFTPCRSWPNIPTPPEFPRLNPAREAEHR